MSHFTTLVVVPDDANLDEVLAPFDQCTENEDYLEFVDITDEEYARWDEEDGTGYSLDGGSTWLSYYEYCQREYSSDNVMKKDMPNKELYPDFAEYMELNGYKSVVVDGEKCYGYFSNPNAKWDWWVVGGRWSGLLRLKPECTGENGTGGFFNAANEDPSFCDIAKVGDIDFEWHKRQQLEATKKRFCDVKKLLEMNSGNEEYTEFIFDKGLFSLRDDDPAIMCETLEEYLAHYKGPKALTYAAIDENGNWAEVASMGWFGLSSGVENEDYHSWFWEWVEALPEDITIAIVDCHI